MPVSITTTNIYSEELYFKFLNSNIRMYTRFGLMLLFSIIPIVKLIFPLEKHNL